MFASVLHCLGTALRRWSQHSGSALDLNRLQKCRDAHLLQRECRSQDGEAAADQSAHQRALPARASRLQSQHPRASLLQLRLRLQRAPPAISRCSTAQQRGRPGREGCGLQRQNSYNPYAEQAEVATKYDMASMPCKYPGSCTATGLAGCSLRAYAKRAGRALKVKHMSAVPDIRRD